MGRSFRKLVTAITFVFSVTFFSTGVEAQLSLGDLASDHGSPPVIQDSVEPGFSKGIVETGVAAGGALGLKIFGTKATHDLILGSIDIGRIMSDTKCPGAWYQGNWELLAEIFGGYQLNHGGAYVVGLTPLVRYNFVDHSRWVPFVEAGGGVSLTDICRPDLSSRFEFNIQAGTGIEYFFCKNIAATLQAKYLHISNAGIESPDHGVNAAVILAGLTWFH